MTGIIESLEARWTEIRRVPYVYRPTDYQQFHREVKSCEAGSNHDDERCELQELRDAVEECMGPKLGPLGGSTAG